MRKRLEFLQDVGPIAIYTRKEKEIVYLKGTNVQNSLLLAMLQ